VGRLFERLGHYTGVDHGEGLVDRCYGGIVVGFIILRGKHVREPDLNELASEPEAASLSLLKLAQRALVRQS